MRRGERGREDGNTVDRQGVRSRQGRIRGPDRFRQRFQDGMRQEIGLKRYIGAKMWRASNAKFRTSDVMRGAEVGQCLGGQHREWMEGEGSRKKRLYQRVTSVVYSEGFQTQITIPVLERGYGCERHWRMSHSFIHSFILPSFIRCLL